MRWAVAILGGVVSLGLWAVSALMNYRFGQSLGKDELDQLAYGVASVCGDGMKVVLPFICVWAYQERRRVTMLAGALLFVIVTGYSLTSSLGYSAAQRSETAGARSLVASSYRDLTAELDRKRTAFEALPAMPGTAQASGRVAALEARIAAAERDRIWTRTTRCTDVTLAVSRRFCADLAEWRAELRASRSARRSADEARSSAMAERERLDREISALAARVEEARARLAREGVAGGDADPQVTFLKRLFSTEEGSVKLALTLLIAAFIELGSGLGFFLSFSGVRRAPRPAAPAREADVVEDVEEAAAPAAVVRLPAPLEEEIEATDADWALDRLVLVEGERSSATALYENYKRWCASVGRDAITLTAFGRWLAEEGLVKRKIGGRIYYLGVRLRTPDDVVVPMAAGRRAAG